MVVLNCFIIKDPDKVKIADKSDFNKESKKCLVFYNRNDYMFASKFLNGYKAYDMKNYILISNKNKWYKVRKKNVYKIGVVVRSWQ